MLAPDIGHVYPKTGGAAGSEAPVDVDLRFDTTPRFVSTGSYYLDGSGDFIDTDGLTVTTDESDFSISFWMKIGAETAQPTAIWRPFGFKNTSTSHRIELWNQSDEFKLLTNNGNGDVTTTAWAVSPGAYQNGWSHFAFSCDWTGSAMNATLYINGQSYGAVAMESDVDLSAADASSIGGGYDGSSSVQGNFCHFGVWHAALTQAQVRNLMTATTYAEAVSRGGSTPRAYYLLEANANDSVGTQNGSAQGNALAVGDRCALPNGLDLSGNRRDARNASGRAIDIDGTGDYISLAHPSDLDGFFNTGGTISMWINMTSTATFERLFDFSGGTSCYLQGSFSGYVFNKDFSTTDGVWTYNGNGGVGLGEWFHFCLSYNAASTSNNPDLYINGVLQTIDGETAPVGSAGADTTEKLFGIAADKSASPLDASLADIKLFTSTVTAAQALEMYQNPEQILPTGIASSALKCWLPCSDYSIATADNSLNGLYAQDASGNGNHGALTNCGMVFNQPSPCPQLGLRSLTSRLYFDQTDDKVTVGNNAAINGLFGSGGSIAFWLNCFSDGGGTYGRIIETAGYMCIVQSESSGNIQLRFDATFGGSSNGTWTGPAASLVLGAWNHVVITYDGSSTSNNPVIYINNSSVTVTESSAPDGSINADTGDKVFGNRAASDRAFHGIISEIAYYKGTILDADAVTVMYNSGVQGFDLLTDSGNYDNSGDVDGWWKLDNPVTIADLSTNSNTGTVAGTPNMATAPEGTTDNLSVFGTMTNLRPPNGLSGVPGVYATPGRNSAWLPAPAWGTDPFTITYWFYSAQPIVNVTKHLWSGTGDPQINIGPSGTSTLLFYAYASAGTGNTMQATATASPTTDFQHKWVFVCARKHSNTSWELDAIPLDGTAVNATSTTEVSASLTSTSAYGVRINGGQTSDATPFYRGSASDIMDVRMWQGEAITDAQMNALYESGARKARGLTR